MRKDVLACYLGIVTVSALSYFFACVPVPLHMISIACMVIFIGAHGSLPAPIKAKPDGDDPNEEYQPPRVTEQMETKDAYMFPVIGSAVLLSLYLVFRFVPKEYINLIIKAYFFVFGTAVLQHRFYTIIAQLIPRRSLKQIDKPIFRIRLPAITWPDPVDPSKRLSYIPSFILALFVDSKPTASTAAAAIATVTATATAPNATTAPVTTSTDSSTDNLAQVQAAAAGMAAAASSMSGLGSIAGFAAAAAAGAEAAAAAVSPGSSSTTPSTDENVIQFGYLDLGALLMSLVVSVLYLQHNHWTASNLLGIAFCIQGIELLGLGSFFNGLVLLCGLFVYDVFWVFGTDVMVTVAKSFDGPIKLLFPQYLDATAHPSMLGLGDIVVPGIFIALMLRFDYSLHTNKQSFSSRPYFFSVLTAYVLGLVATVLVMYHFQHAQPALLYLVPACLVSSLLTAVVRGQFRLLFNFSETTPQKTD
jgi:hypothetical protein